MFLLQVLDYLWWFLPVFWVRDAKNMSFDLLYTFSFFVPLFLSFLVVFFVMYCSYWCWICFWRQFSKEKFTRRAKNAHSTEIRIPPEQWRTSNIQPPGHYISNTVLSLFLHLWKLTNHGGSELEAELGVFNKEEGAKFRPVRRKHCSKNNGSLLLIMSLLVVVLVVTVVRSASAAQQRQQGSLGSENDPTLSNKKDNDTLRKEPNSNKFKQDSKRVYNRFAFVRSFDSMRNRSMVTNQRLELGHSICNAEWRFGVGIMIDEDGSSKGALLWQDCNRDVLLNVTKHDLEFQMTEQGMFQLLDGDSTVLWQLKHPMCLQQYAHRAVLRIQSHMDCRIFIFASVEETLSWIGSAIGGTRARCTSYPGLFPADYN